MNYSITAITTTADCDVLLTGAGREKADLEFKKLSEERLVTKYTETSVEVDAILQGVLAELSSVNTVIGILPDGPRKDEELKKKVRLEYKKFVLEDRKESYGAVALLEKEMDLKRVVKQLDEVNDFIAIVTAHKATL